jgi:outer membrane protein
MSRILKLSIAVTLVGQVAWAAPASSDSIAGPALTLAQAEQNALRHQPTVRQAEGQTEAAAGRVEEARAGYLPQINASATYYIVRSGALTTTVTTGSTMPVATQGTMGGNSALQYGLWSAGVSGSQLIYDFNATANRWRSAAWNRDAAQSSEKVAALQALLNVRRAYFTARAERDLVRVAQEAVANQQKHLDQITDMVTAGMKSQIDLATQRTASANARVAAVIAENAYAADLALLNQAMGLPSGSGFELTDTEMPPVAGEDGDERQLIDGAIKARPEVVAAEQQRRGQELLAASYKGNYLPAISAVGGVTDVGTTSDRANASWYLGLSATWALLSGGLTTGQVREANGTLAALSAQADGVRLQVSVDVVQGQLAVRAAKSSIDGAEEALTNAREQLRLAEARYQTGQGSIIELADAQVAYTTAEAQEVSARYSLASARAQFLMAVGER